MASDEKDEKWGTIFLDSKRESTLSQLDAMQAASRQEQWNQRTQQDYMEKVRAKAVDRAREILGEAYTERQKVLEEAEAEAESIRNEANKIKANAESIRNEAQNLKHDVQAELDKALHMQSTAQEDGFQAGLKQAQEELDSFRLNMGASVAGVLKAIEKQTLNIFAGWRTELVDLVKVCVERGTGLALDERYNKILEQLVIEAVRNLDDRRHVVLKVHPDDEAVMADIFAAAKEKLPDLGQWGIETDESLELGGLVAESSSGTVDSRLELFKEMVDNILEHLALPESNLDAAGAAFVEKITELEKENLEQFVQLEEESVKEVIEDVLDEVPAQAEENTGQDSEIQEDLEQVNQQEDITPDPEQNIENLEANPVEASAETNVESAQNNVEDELADANAIVDDLLPQDEILAEQGVQASDETFTESSVVQEQDIIDEDTQNSQPSDEERSRLELEEELLPLPDVEDVAEVDEQNSKADI